MEVEYKHVKLHLNGDELACIFWCISDSLRRTVEEGYSLDSRKDALKIFMRIGDVFWYEPEIIKDTWKTKIASKL